MSAPEPVDALVVGGGSAGLAAALWLGRNRCRTVVADRGEPRNRWVEASFGYLGFDAEPPHAILQAGRNDLRRYPDVELVDDGVRSVHRLAGPRFEAEVGHRCLHADAVVIATGVRDVVPPLPGLGRHYGKQVFVCPLCDGFEVRDLAVVVLGAAGEVGPFAEELQTWAGSIVVVPLGPEAPGGDLPAGVELAAAPATEVVGPTERLDGIRLADGAFVPADAVFLRSEVAAVTDLAAHLGCELDDDGLVVVDADGATSVEGVYAAGDCTPGPQLLQVAAAEGTRAGLRCARRLRELRDRR